MPRLGRLRAWTPVRRGPRPSGQRSPGLRSGRGLRPAQRSCGARPPAPGRTGAAWGGEGWGPVRTAAGLGRPGTALPPRPARQRPPRPASLGAARVGGPEGTPPHRSSQHQTDQSLRDDENQTQEPEQSRKGSRAPPQPGRPAPRARPGVRPGRPGRPEGAAPGRGEGRRRRAEGPRARTRCSPRAACPGSVACVACVRAVCLCV